MDCTDCVAKTRALISFAVTAKLIWVFVFAYAKSRVSYDVSHFTILALMDKTKLFEIRKKSLDTQGPDF